MKKQTAVEWLFAHLLPFLEFSDSKEREHFRKCLAESIAMERDQIIEAYREGRTDQHSGMEKFHNRSSASYYNQTYGQ